MDCVHQFSVFPRPLYHRRLELDHVQLHARVLSELVAMSIGQTAPQPVSVSPLRMETVEGRSIIDP